MFDKKTQKQLPQGLKDRICKKQVSVLSFAPDRTRLAAGGDDRIWVYDLSSEAQFSVLSGHTGRIRSLSFAPDSRTLASSSEDSSLRLWDTDSSNEIATLAGESSSFTTALATSPDGVPLTGWNEETARLLGSTTSDPAYIRTITFSTDGSLLVSGGADGKIRVWEIETGRELSSFAGHDGLVLSLAFSPDGKYLASGGSDTTVRLWEWEDKHLLSIWTGHSDSVSALSISSDSSILASGGRDPQIILWNIKALGRMGHISSVEGYTWEIDFWQTDEKEQLVTVNRDGELYIRE